MSHVRELNFRIKVIPEHNDLLIKFIDEFQNSETFRYFIKDKDHGIDQLSRVDQYLSLQEDIARIEKDQSLTEKQKAQKKSNRELQYKAYINLHRYTQLRESIEVKESLSNALMELTKYFEKNGYKGVKPLYRQTKEYIDTGYNFSPIKIPQEQYI
jgi:hypothetical protein